jgi:cysteinyl-tRNA synthetase
MIFNLFKKTMPRAMAQKPLYLHNTLSGKLELFESINGTVRMYNCGPTAYDEQHVGNLFPPVVANVLHRTLLQCGYSVKEVNNITDFGHISDDESSEDKMTKGLIREGMSPTLENMRVLAEKYAKLFFADLPQLGVDIKKVLYPRASDYIDAQIELIKTLEQKGFAYPTKDGVYFNTAKYQGYGKLGHINLGGQLAGARVEENKEKKNANDFALWKKDSKLGWESPWGLGFPGWHTECVAMIFSLLGRQIDIHMGGNDLIPIHHNNEIAQAEAATGKQFVRYWVHNAHITIEGKKVSKSLGNTVYLHNITDQGLNARALRYWFLTGHYRTPMNFTWDALEGANTALKRLQRSFLEMPKGGKADTKFLDEFYGFILQDLDTPKALARVWDLLKDESVAPADKRASIAEADKILGLGIADERITTKLPVIEESDLPEDVQHLLDERTMARIAKNYARADELRIQIEGLGYELTDTAEGQKVTRK